jgi:hypothetical protein
MGQLADCLLSRPKRLGSRIFRPRRPRVTGGRPIPWGRGQDPESYRKIVNWASRMRCGWRSEGVAGGVSPAVGALEDWHEEHGSLGFVLCGARRRRRLRGRAE